MAKDERIHHDAHNAHNMSRAGQALRTIFLASVFLFCSGFGWSGPECCGRTGYTRQVVPLGADAASEPSVLVPAEFAGAKTPAQVDATNDTAPLTALMSLDLTLRDYAWKAKSLFGRLLTADGEMTLLPDSISMVSEVVLDRLIAPVRGLSTQIMTRFLGTRTDSQTMFSASFSPVLGTGADVVAARRYMESRSPSTLIVGGRMPSLATSMGSDLDPAMGFDDVARRNDSGWQVGLRIEKTFDSGPGADGVELLVVPSLPGT